MKKTLLFILLFLGFVLNAQAQSTTVSGTVTDGGGQTWNNGNYTFQLVPNPNFTNLASYTWTGGTLNQTITGTLNGSGAYSQSVPSNTAISPQGSKWQLKVCPQATFSCFAAPNTTISGATQTLNVTPPVIAISLINPINTLAYSDSEIVSAIVGSMYYNLTTQQERICQAVTIQTCTTWSNIGAGAGGSVTSISSTSPIVATPNPITGVGNISCPTCTTGPGGTNTQVQFNDAGAFGGNSAMTFAKTTGSFQVNGGASGDSFLGANNNFLEALSGGVNVDAQSTGGVVSIFTTSGNITIDPGVGKDVTIGGPTQTNSGHVKLIGTTSGSATVGVADIAGTSNRINLPTTTGTSGQVLTTDGANPQQTSWVTPGSGTVNPATQFSVPFYSAVGSATTLSGLAAPTTPNGVPQTLTSTPSGGVGVSPVFSLSGVPFDAQVNPGGNAYTIPAIDRSALLTLSNSSATAVTLPQANSTGFGSNFSFADLNLGAGLETITPTTSTINGAASQIVPANWFGIEYSDNTNYRMPVLPTISAFPDCQDSSGNHLNFTAATGALSCGATGSPSLLTSAPPWLRFFGDGSDGAININAGASSYSIPIHQATTFVCSTAITGSATSGIDGGIVIFATTSIALNTGCSITNNGATATGANTGDVGGSGGGGGGGTLGGAAGQANLIPRNGAFLGGTSAGLAGTAGGTTGGAGGNGGGPNTNYQKAYLWMPPYSPWFLAGGGRGGAGGSSGGAAGFGAAPIMLIAPTITIASGVILDSGGQQGTCASANNTGAGGGGGGGLIIIAAKTFTDSGATYNVTGGPGGCTFNPQVLLCVPGMAMTSGTCPGTAPVGVPAFTTGAFAHVSTFSGGNPTVVTVDTAGSGYTFTPGCLIVGTGGGANTGSGATCTVTMSAGTVSSISVSGGNGGYGTGTTFTTAGNGGYGGSGWEKSVTIQ